MQTIRSWKQWILKWIGVIAVMTIVLHLLESVSNADIYAADAIYWPVPGHTNISQGWHNNNAIDISDSSIGGADVIAACGGTVCKIFLCPDQHYPNIGDCNGFGTGLVINGDDGRVYQYAHMQANSIPSNVYYGAYVNAGQKIGKVGTTGNSTGNHLHFGISYEKYWYESGINPLNENYIYTSAHTCTYTSSIIKQPTCIENGIKKYVCSCGNSYTEEIPATGHKYSDTIVLPTTTDKGYTLHTYLTCNDSYKDSYVNLPEKREDGWFYCDILPSDITDTECTIEYNNLYEKIQQTAPDASWKNEGVVKNEWQNSGEQYTSPYDLETSDSRVLIDSVYYHFCGPNTGTEGNYELSGNFVHYDAINPNNVTAKYLGDDNGHPYYFLYWSDGNQVWCNSDVSCDGSWGTHGNRCRAWYKQNTYQDRSKIELYKFTKQSGWISELDSAANHVTYRYRERHDFGDLNQDTILTVSDAVLLQKYLLNESTLTEAQYSLADLNADGTVNGFDLALLRQKLLA